ncbi:TPA: fibronectin type III domain-containing protein [Bacillus cereus]|nr:fibronectin type III domain-containing protein [Bacillus cereus]
MIVSVFSFSVLTKADDTNVFASKKIYQDFQFVRQVEPNHSYKVNDASDSTYYDLPSPVYSDLGTNYDLSGLRLLATKNDYNSIKFSVTFYNSEKQELYTTRTYDIGSSAKQDKLEYTNNLSVKNVRYIRMNGGGRIHDLKIFGSVYRPSITNLKDVVNGDNVDFSWSNPIDQIFKGVKIYRGSELIATVDPKESSYKVSNLEAGKEYDFKFVSIYEKDGNILESETLNKKIKTKMPVIKPPENVYITPQDKKIVIAWDDVKSPFLQGYNVYVDGKKINDKPLTSNKLIVKNLENDKSYKVQVSAINKDDVEGEKSKEVSEKPSSDALEVEYDVTMPFDPKDVLGVVMAFLLIVGPLILLGLAIRFHKPIITFLYNSIQNKKGRDEK